MHAKILALLLSIAFSVAAEQVTARQAQGLIRGFLLLRSLDGALLASGDLSQTSKGGQVTSKLALRFKDGSIHEETAVFSQQRVFRLLTYRLVRRGPAFKRATEMNVVGSTGEVTVRYTDDDGKEKTVSERIKLPPDFANGMVPTLLTSIAPSTPKTTVSFVASTPKPQVVKLDISPEGEESFSVGGVSHKAVRYVVKVDIGGISGVVAPIIGKQPPDTHVWIAAGAAPGFLKSEGPLYEGGPVWRIELASPVWPKAVR